MKERARRTGLGICKPFFQLWKSRHKAKPHVRQAASRCATERERLQEEGALEIFLRKFGYVAEREALSSRAMGDFVKVHRDKLIELDATSYKAANRNSKSGMFAYLNDLIIEGNGHRKKCWQHAPPRRTSALELCDRPSSLADK